MALKDALLRTFPTRPLAMASCFTLRSRLGGPAECALQLQVGGHVPAEYRIGRDPLKPYHGLFLMLVCIFLAQIPLVGQAVSAVSGKPPTLSVTSSRPLADVLQGVQRYFSSSVTYEEAPTESPTILSDVTVVTGAGPKVMRAMPVASFSVTLGATDTSPYQAVQTVLYTYQNAGLPGGYTVVQSENRVNVIPSQVLGADGSMRAVTPMMGQPVTFPVATRGAEDTIQLIIDQISSKKGVKAFLLNVPFGNLDMIELGAAGRPARDVIGDIGAKLNRPISFQCLYEPTDKTYYLNVGGVSAPEGPGRAAPIGPLLTPTMGPPNSPWFSKSE